MAEEKGTQAYTVEIQYAYGGTGGWNGLFRTALKNARNKIYAELSHIYIQYVVDIPVLFGYNSTVEPHCVSLCGFKR